MFIVIKKTYLILTGVLLTFLLCTIFIVALASEKNESPTIIIDAGHGEPDGGCVGADKTKEATLNLSVSKKLENMLSEDYNVIMTRTTENGIHDKNLKSIAEKKRSDMRKRQSLKSSSNADIFVSIHMNKFEQQKYYGAQVIYDKTNENAKLLAEEIQSELAKIDPTNKRQAMAAEKSVFLLKSSPVPSVIVECGFLSNPSELEKLKSDEYQSQISNAINNGIRNYFSANC